MSRRLRIKIAMLYAAACHCVIAALFLMALSGLSEADAQTNNYGPAVQEFLRYLRQEQEELDYHIKRKEITQREYTRSTSRIAVHRAAVLDFVRMTGEDRIPEYHVVVASEADQLLPKGVASLKKLRPGDLIDEKWRFVRTVRKGELFYIVERVKESRPPQPGSGR